MKLLVKKLWFPRDVETTIDALFEIPQMQELFKEGYKYVGEMRPRGIKKGNGYWPAKAIMERLPKSEKDVFLILTEKELEGEYGGIYGTGRDRKAIISSDAFVNKVENSFNSENISFNATAFGEIGHALGLEHHNFNRLDPCEMSHNEIRPAHWKSLDEVRFCDDCYKRIQHD